MDNTGQQWVSRGGGTREADERKGVELTSLTIDNQVLIDSIKNSKYLGASSMHLAPVRPQRHKRNKTQSFFSKGLHSSRHINKRFKDNIISAAIKGWMTCHVITEERKYCYLGMLWTSSICLSISSVNPCAPHKWDGCGSQPPRWPPLVSIPQLLSSRITLGYITLGLMYVRSNGM